MKKHTYGAAIAQKELDRAREKGFTQANDMAYTNGELLRAAAAYLLNELDIEFPEPDLYPFPAGTFKHNDPNNLQKVAAFLLAEFERQNNEYLNRKVIQVSVYERENDPESVIFVSVLANKIVFPSQPLFTFYWHYGITNTRGNFNADDENVICISELHSRTLIAQCLKVDLVEATLHNIFKQKSVQEVSDAIRNKKAQYELLAKNYAIRKAAL